MSGVPSILAIDQGTTGSTAMVVAQDGRILGRAYSEFTQHFPRPGWVEHDAGEIWEVTRRVSTEALGRAAPEAMVEGIGIANQRETVVLWDRKTLDPVHRAGQSSRGFSGTIPISGSGRRPEISRWGRLTHGSWPA